jgi:putative transcriptional regulator
MATAKKGPGRARGRPAVRTTTAKATQATPRRPPRGGKGMDPALFAELLESVREGGRILRGEQEAARSVTAEEIRAAAAADRQRDAVPDAGAIRERLGLSQVMFAELLGISRRTLEGWEQGRREPEGPARVLLRVAATYPEALLATRRRSS